MGKRRCGGSLTKSTSQVQSSNEGNCKARRIIPSRCSCHLPWTEQQAKDTKVETPNQQWNGIRSRISAGSEGGGLLLAHKNQRLRVWSRDLSVGNLRRRTGDRILPLAQRWKTVRDLGVVLTPCEGWRGRRARRRAHVAKAPAALVSGTLFSRRALHMVALLTGAIA